ncbi:pretranslocase subunit SecB family protein, partial [Vibrio harveyi]
NSYC